LTAAVADRGLCLRAEKLEVAQPFALTAAVADRGLCLRAEKSQSQNTPNAEYSPLGEDVQRTEEVQCMLC